MCEVDGADIHTRSKVNCIGMVYNAGARITVIIFDMTAQKCRKNNKIDCSSELSVQG